MNDGIKNTKNKLRTTINVLIALMLSTVCFGQRIDSIFDKINPQKFSAAIEKKVSKLEDRIIIKSEKTLRRLQNQEIKIYRKQLATKDSLIAKAKLAEIETKYAEMKMKLSGPAPIPSVSVKKYIGHLDSISTAVKFLDQNGNSMKSTISGVGSLEGRMQQSEEIKKFVLERREQLKQQLGQLGSLKELKRFNKEVYYYSEQLKQWKQILNDPEKVEKKVIELLSKTKLFQDFMQKNSMLSVLFPMPGNLNDPAYQVSTAGLQTRVQVNNLLQQQIAVGGPNALTQLRQNFQQAQSQLQQLKDKINRYGNGNSDDVLPEGFKPNNQKTKSFFKRLEVGTNIQSQKGSRFFPITSDLGFSLGYKLNDKSIIGVGASYKLGWGNNWNDIKITQEGAGIRSYIDWRLKGSFWISGGYEMNYRTVFNNVAQLQNLNAWQQSGMVGLSKIVNIKNKFFKKTKLQLLWDFLSYRQLPRTQPIIFRVGYSLN